ncbi:hypothetical protein QBC39DRAFT_355985 [Podospora conica]|nr:hypothetical protein QBC39DRAFT_355985 [Schizothecium conicum]
MQRRTIELPPSFEGPERIRLARGRISETDGVWRPKAASHHHFRRHFQPGTRASAVDSQSGRLCFALPANNAFTSHSHRAEVPRANCRAWHLCRHILLLLVCPHYLRSPRASNSRRRKRSKPGRRPGLSSSAPILPSHHNCLGLTEIPPVSHKTWWIALSPVESTRICICDPRQHVCASFAVPGTLETGHLRQDAAIRNIVQ